MAARAIASTTISFGLVSIPTKLYTAAASEQVHFNMLQKGTGARLKQQYVSAADGSVVERADTVRGYEHARGQYVLFTDEELKQLESDRGKHIEILEFVPLSSVDFVSVEKSYYLGPDKGGDRAYQLLAECMREADRVAVGQYAARGKEQLVLIRPYGKGGLVLHQLFYASEVRRFDEIDPGVTLTFSDVERELAKKLIEQLSVPTFDASKYKDVYAERVLAAVEQKVAGQEVTTLADQPQAKIIDLFEALKRSLAAAGGDAATPPADAAPPAEPKAAKGRKRGATADAADAQSADPAAGDVPPRPLKKASSKRGTGKQAATG